MQEYSWSFDRENWNEEPENSIEKCLKAAKKNKKSSDYLFVYIGNNVPFIPQVSAYSVLDEIEDDAAAFSDDGEDWEACESNSKKELNELSKQLTDVVHKWLKKQSLYPNLWHIENVKRYSLEKSL